MSTLLPGQEDFDQQERTFRRALPACFIDTAAPASRSIGAGVSPPPET
jgi:hypothetical protein